MTLLGLQCPMADVCPDLQNQRCWSPQTHHEYPCTTQRTRKHLLLDDDGEDADPWRHGADLGANAKLLQKPSAKASGAAMTKLAQMQEDLRQDVHDIVRQQITVCRKACTGAARQFPLPLPRLMLLKLDSRDSNTRVANLRSGPSPHQAKTQVQEQKQAIHQCRSDLQQSLNQAVSGQLQGQFGHPSTLHLRGLLPPGLSLSHSGERLLV